MTTVAVDNLKLLIIEDDADQRELIVETLEAYFGRGRVVAVGSRAEALQQPLGQFDLILSDYNLPDSSGLELLQAIKSRCTTPVIMVTGENVGTTAVEAIKLGATDYVVKVGEYLLTIPLVVEKNLTFANVMRENEKLRLELQHKNAQLEASLKQVEEMAATDPLTRLYNRRHFGRVLEQLFAEAQRYEKDLACVMIDMDGFKQINDRRGHQFGDQLLVLAGKVIGANMRRMDVAARYGGDEFVLLLPHASTNDAVQVAQRIREEFKSAASNLTGAPALVSLSCGVASSHCTRPAGAEQLVGNADAALYRAKQSGRDRIETATPVSVPPAAPARKRKAG